MKRLAKYFVLVLVSAAALPEIASAQPVRYVDASAAGADDGSSWVNAFVFLQDALV